MTARTEEEERTPAPAVQFAHASEEEFAKLLDFYDVAWQYEPRTFTLREKDGRILEAFTPDFYLPDLDLYIELTTLKQKLVTEKNRKLRRLQERYPEVEIKLLYRSDYLSLLAKYGFGPFSEVEVAGIHEVLISATDIERRVGELGDEISRDYIGWEPLMIGVLTGVVCFMADLMRQ
ncbi:MAG: hypoxanthine phosphoribosyltransferase, partial [Dehalococcoidia bacterium]